MHCSAVCSTFRQRRDNKRDHVVGVAVARQGQLDYEDQAKEVEEGKGCCRATHLDVIAPEPLCIVDGPCAWGAARPYNLICCLRHAFKPGVRWYGDLAGRCVHLRRRKGKYLYIFSKKGGRY